MGSGATEPACFQAPFARGAGAHPGSREPPPPIPGGYGALEMSPGGNKTESSSWHSSALVRNWYLTDLDGYQ